MPTYRTPDIYIEEIPLFPPSIAEVETAIPVFIGHTRFAEYRGESLFKKAVKITSLMEYHERFGQRPPANVDEISIKDNNRVDGVSQSISYNLYDSLQIFFLNGGGPCFIVSIGNFEDDDNGKITKDKYIEGLRVAEKADEITLLLLPDAVNLSNQSLYTVQQQALNQCNKLMDRFCVFDLYEDPAKSAPWHDGVVEFRNKIGINHLKYGAAYTPYLVADITKDIDYSHIRDHLFKGKERVHLSDLTDDGRIMDQIAEVEKALKTVNELSPVSYKKLPQTSPLVNVMPNIKNTEDTDLEKFLDEIEKDKYRTVQEYYNDKSAKFQKAINIGPLLKQQQDTAEKALAAAEEAQGLADLLIEKSSTALTKAVKDKLVAASNALKAAADESQAASKTEGSFNEKKAASKKATDKAQEAVTSVADVVSAVEAASNESATGISDAGSDETALAAAQEVDKLTRRLTDISAKITNETAVAAEEIDVGDPDQLLLDLLDVVNSTLTKVVLKWIDPDTPISVAIKQHITDSLSGFFEGLANEWEEKYGGIIGTAAGWSDPYLVILKNYNSPYHTNLIKIIEDLKEDEELQNGSFTPLDRKGQIDKFFSFFLDHLKSMQGAAHRHYDNVQNSLRQTFPLYDNIVQRTERELKTLPPSGAIAGIYASVDRDRGVWKAPANVSLSAVSDVSHDIDSYAQEELNIDVNAGKSINAIRPFIGKGTLVWGARTLMGNDNEWRYVSVRRFFNMVEESLKKSTYWAVFEPNDANLWMKVKSSMEAYLHEKRMQGALAGATDEQAFQVNVGLNDTMTAQDILEGRLIIEIKMAVVRPAEFIIMRFMHKMQES